MLRGIVSQHILMGHAEEYLGDEQKGFLLSCLSGRRTDTAGTPDLQSRSAFGISVWEEGECAGILKQCSRKVL